MTVEALLAVIGSIVIPLVGCAVWLAGRLARLEGEIKSLSQLKVYENKSLDNRISKLERHVHDIRNYLQSLSLSLVRGSEVRSDNIPHLDDNDDTTSFMQL